MQPKRSVIAAATVLALLAIATGTYLKVSRDGEAARAGISGTWERTPDGWFGENLDDPVHPGGPMDLKAPYARAYAELKQKQAAANAAGTPLATTSAKCLPEGMPTMMAALFPIQIIHDDRQVVVLGEYLQQVRRILLDQPMPAVEDMDPTYQGYSRGRWKAASSSWKPGASART